MHLLTLDDGDGDDDVCVDSSSVAFFGQQRLPARHSIGRHSMQEPSH